MMYFIYLCMAVFAISFIAVPVFIGISDEHDRIVETWQADISSNQIQNANKEDESLSFDEIYALARESDTSPRSLSDISPAAGEDSNPDDFTDGFSRIEDPALADTSVELIIEKENLTEIK